MCAEEKYGVNIIFTRRLRRYVEMADARGYWCILPREDPSLKKNSIDGIQVFINIAIRELLLLSHTTQDDVPVHPPAEGTPGWRSGVSPAGMRRGPPTRRGRANPRGGRSSSRSCCWKGLSRQARHPPIRRTLGRCCARRRGPSKIKKTTGR